MDSSKDRERRTTWKEFAKLWLTRAKSADDPLFKFMCLMIAFNDLWTITDKKAANAVDGKESTSAKKLIAILTFRVLNELKKHGVSFSLPPLPELHKEIHEGNACGESTLFAHWGYGPTDTRTESEQEIVDIFIKIYIVRNNLFHGWKTTMPWDTTDFRDNKLVVESCTVLETFLPALLSLISLPGIQPKVQDRKERFRSQNTSHYERISYAIP